LKLWVMFIALAMIWSSSFLLIKVGLAPEGTDPAAIGKFDSVSLATTRLTVAALCYVTFVLATRRKFPRNAKTWLYLFIAGLTNNALPFMLITWGEKSIDSGLAGVLNGTTPLFSLVMAHLALGDDRISLGKIFGIIGGFTGVVLLATRSTDTANQANALAGQLAVVVASMCYAFATVFMRRNLRGLDPYVTGASSISMGALILIVISLLTVHPLPNFTALQPEALRAVLALGFFNTFIAYLLYFTILPTWGASRTTMVTYVMPPMSVLLGVVFAQELVDWKLLAGAALILGSVVAANLWKTPLTLRRKEVVAAEA